MPFVFIFQENIKGIICMSYIYLYFEVVCNES